MYQDQREKKRVFMSALSWCQQQKSIDTNCSSKCFHGFWNMTLGKLLNLLASASSSMKNKTFSLHYCMWDEMLTDTSLGAPCWVLPSLYSCPFTAHNFCFWGFPRGFVFCYMAVFFYLLVILRDINYIFKILPIALLL